MKRRLIGACLLAWAAALGAVPWEEPWALAPAAPAASRVQEPDASAPLLLLGQDLLWAYQSLLSGRNGSVCPFFPSCSRYAGIAIQEHGLGLGAILSADRLLRCHREPDPLLSYPRLSAGVEASILDLPSDDAWWRP